MLMLFNFFSGSPWIQGALAIADLIALSFALYKVAWPILKFSISASRTTLKAAFWRRRYRLRIEILRSARDPSYYISHLASDAFSYAMLGTGLFCSAIANILLKFETGPVTKVGGMVLLFNLATFSVSFATVAFTSALRAAAVRRVIRRHKYAAGESAVWRHKLRHKAGDHQRQKSLPS